MEIDIIVILYCFFSASTPGNWMRAHVVHNSKGESENQVHSKEHANGELELQSESSQHLQITRHLI